MKRIITMISAAAFLSAAAFAAEPKISPYGFIRNYTVFDSREVNAGTEDLYFYMPKDLEKAVPTFRMLSLTTRMGLNLSGFDYGDTKIGGTIEADFYSMNGSTAVLRMRQAYVKIAWNDFSLNVGQTWHPMAADMPHITNLETGAPFNPFNRSPQAMLTFAATEKLSMTGGFIYGMQYLPTGPSGKTEAYMKYGLIPEIYLGLTYKDGGFMGKVGVDVMSLKPHTNQYPGFMEDRITMVSPFLYGQYTKGLFQVKAKTILAQGGEHMNLLSGYGISREAKAGYVYTPMRDWASFISFQYGKKFQVLGMIGYMKQLGTPDELMRLNDGSRAIWINTAAATNITEAFRMTPTIAWNLGKLTLSLEYNLTAARFGEGARGEHGLFENSHWRANHRIEQMVKLNF